MSFLLFVSFLLLQGWATSSPAFLSTEPTTSSASVNLASRKCAGTFSSSNKTWQTSPCHVRLTWTSQGELRALIVFVIIVMPTMQLDGWYGEVKRTEVVTVIFTFPLCCVGGSAKIPSELSVSSVCPCWVISVHVILLTSKLRQGNVSRCNCCVEFQLDEGGASDCPNELRFSLLKI